MSDAQQWMGNIRRYPWYLFFRDCYFWGPAFFLYFASVLPLNQVLWLEAIYYVGVAVFEVPSGYLSDRFGRRWTLILSSACLAAAYLLFFVGTRFATFAAAQVILAAGFAAASGTDTSLHFESLKGAGLSSEYAAREGKALRFSFLGGAGAALVGGLIATGHLRWVYGASFLTALVSLGIAFAMIEPEKGHESASPMGTQVVELVKKSWTPRLRFFTIYVVGMTILVHLPYEFYQPYIGSLAGGSFGASTPAIAGGHLAITMVVGAWCTRFAGRFTHRCTMRRTLVACTLIQVVLVAAMALWVHPLVAVLLMGRTAGKAIYLPLINAEVSPLLRRHQRSTYLSLQSLAGRLAYSFVLVLLPMGSLLARGGLHGTLVCSAVLGSSFLVLIVLLPFPREPHHICCSDHKPPMASPFRSLIMKRRGG